MRLRTYAHADEVSRQKSAAIFPHFGRRFAAMAAMTQALQIGGIDKQSPVAPMGRDVVNIRRPDPSALPCAFPTKGFFQELHRPQSVPKDGLGIPAVPACRLRTAAILGLVFWTIAVARQSATADACAGFQSFQGHGLSPPDKTKKPEPTHLHGDWLRLIGSGSCNRYSQRSHSCTLGSRPEGSSPSFPAALWRLFPVRKRDTATIHPSWIFYHISFYFARVSLPFSFKFPENIHYLKSEISARLSSFVPGGSMASMYSKHPYSFCAGLFSKM
jgi:hypothetical protein